jgi:plastocyanin
VADPEQIYSEVLAEEQSKGSAAPVAEGRAKAARARAEAGSPNPKEPKWWPGAQPHLGGGDGEAPAEPAEEPAEAVGEPAEAEETSVEAPVAEETPAATEEQPAQVPQEQTAPPAEPAAPAAATAPAPAAQAPAPVAVAEAPAEAKPSGVIHGTVAGNRLRPEDAVTTDAQFQGQAAMYARRKLIDELVGTGVPAISAHESGERRSPALALLYLLIPIMAIAFLLANNDSAPADGDTPPPPGGITLAAAGVAFDTDQIDLTADEATTLTFDNEDTVTHNFSIYEDDSASKDLFVGAELAGGSSIDYDIPALEAGEYFFRCDLHPTSMTGTVTVE